MKRLTQSIIFLVAFFSVSSNYSQCNNGAIFTLPHAYTPITGLWASATMVNWAGEVIKVNVISGDVYEFSTCSAYGGVSATYDTELTLRDDAGNLLATTTTTLDVAIILTSIGLLPLREKYICT